MPNCKLFIGGECRKFERRKKCEPSSGEWLDSVTDNHGEFVLASQMCEKSSIFGNTFIGLTETDVGRLCKGDILHIPGEYGIFIGIKELG